MRVVVTGATGFIGRHLTSRLKEEGKLSEAEFLDIDARIGQEVQAAVEFADASPWEALDMLTSDVGAAGVRP